MGPSTSQLQPPTFGLTDRTLLIGSDRSHDRMWEAEGKVGGQNWEADIGGRKWEAESVRPIWSLSQSESQNSASHIGLTDRPPKLSQNITFDITRTCYMK